MPILFAGSALGLLLVSTQRAAPRIHTGGAPPPYRHITLIGEGDKVKIKLIAEKSVEAASLLMEQRAGPGSFGISHALASPGGDARPATCNALMLLLRDGR